VRGRLVRELMRTPSVKASWHSVIWDGVSNAGARVEAGAYFARLETAAGVVSREVILER